MMQGDGYCDDECACSGCVTEQFRRGGMAPLSDAEIAITGVCRECEKRDAVIRQLRDAINELSLHHVGYYPPVKELLEKYGL